MLQTGIQLARQRYSGGMGFYLGLLARAATQFGERQPLLWHMSFIHSPPESVSHVLFHPLTRTESKPGSCGRICDIWRKPGNPTNWLECLNQGVDDIRIFKSSNSVWWEATSVVVLCIHPPESVFHVSFHHLTVAGFLILGGENCCVVKLVSSEHDTRHE